MNYERFDHKEISSAESPLIRGDAEGRGVCKSIYLVNMTKELDHHFSQLALQSIEKYKGKKIGILVNKKGYSNGIICRTCGHIPQCSRCSVSITYHRLVSGEMMGLCHICKTQYNYPTSCPQCKNKNIHEFGFGTQKVAEYLKQDFHVSSTIIESETVNSVNKINNLKVENIVIGTSLLATPIKNKPFDLIVFLNADLGLNIPDYTSAEKNFYFLYETFIKHQTNNFIVQSFNPDHYSIRNACKLDKNAFYEADNAFRKTNNYPPYADLCVILYKNEIEERLFNKVDTLHKELLYLKEKYEQKNLEIYSTPPLIYKMFGKYRYNIILKGPQLRNFMDIAYTKLNMASKGFKIDRDAESIV